MRCDRAHYTKEQYKHSPLSNKIQFLFRGKISNPSMLSYNRMPQEEFTAFKNREKEITDWLSTEFANIQSGRITPSIIEKVTVETYGAKTALSHCATITLKDPKTLTVTPYDPTLLPEIEKALQDQTTAMSIAPGEKNVRVIAPEMTEERRNMLKNTVQERTEEAKQSIRGVREKILATIKKKKTETEISEDEEFAAKKELQEKTDEANKKIEEMCAKKMEDIEQ